MWAILTKSLKRLMVYEIPTYLLWRVMVYVISMPDGDNESHTYIRRYYRG